RIIQKNALSDETINERSDWDQACSLMENVVTDNENEIKQSLDNLTGPSKWTQWFSWSYETNEQIRNRKISSELFKLVKHRDKNTLKLEAVEISNLIQNLQTQGVNVKPETLHFIWEHIYLINFYKQAVEGIHDCRKYHRSNDFSNHKLGCNDVLLFFKIHKLLQQTVITLRQQISTLEARRLENFVKDSLENYSVNEDKKKQILSGKQVELAIEIQNVHKAKVKLEKFIETLLHERNL
ncbi:hypothetical protein MXB_2857, partial [Myxobolus squamalis]